MKDFLFLTIFQFRVIELLYCYHEAHQIFSIILNFLEMILLSITMKEETMENELY